MATPVSLIDKTIDSVKISFLLIGVNIKYNKTSYDKYRCWFIYLINFLWAYTDVGGSFVWFFNGLVQGRPFTELTYVAPCAFGSIISNIKTLNYIINETTIDSMITNLRNLENRQNERQGNAETKRIISVEDNYVNKVIKVSYIIYIALIVSFAVNPLLMIFIKYYTTNNVELLLPFLSVYAFDAFDMRYYPWVYLHQLWTDYVIIIGYFIGDVVFYVFAAYIKTQFLLLRHYIENLIPEHTKERCNSETTKQKLMELIKWHQEIISLVGGLERVFSKSTLLSFVASSVLICLTLFNVKAIDDLGFVFTFILFLVLILSHVYFLCSFGDMVMQSSMAIGSALYNSKWYLADLKSQKTMLVIMTRAQKPCKLTAANFADVNLNAFLKICSTSWSYFALLQTMYEID